MESLAEVHAAEKHGPDVPVHVTSSRFGAFDVPTGHILHFAQGLVGFPSSTRFVILDHRPGSPFKWMLSLDDPELGFAVADPSELVAGYRPPATFAARLLGSSPGDIGIFAIVTIPEDPTRMTINLLAPVAVDLKTHHARQIVLEGGQYDPVHRILPDPTAPLRPKT